MNRKIPKDIKNANKSFGILPAHRSCQGAHSHSPPAEQLSHLMIESTLAKMAIILHHTFPVPSYLAYSLEP